MPDENRTTKLPEITERCVGDVIEFPGTGRVEVRMIEDGEIYFASWKDGTDEPWLARMTFDHFEASLVRTREKLER